MREAFNEKQRGDTLSADHLNRLSEVARSLSTIATSGAFLHQGAWTAIAMEHPHIEWLARVSSDIADQDDTDNSGRYLAVPRYFDHDTSEWKDGDDEQEVDARSFTAKETFDTQRGLVLLPCDIITVRYDEQRGVFLPVEVPLVRTAAVETVAYQGQEARVRIYDRCGITNRYVYAENNLFDLPVQPGDTVRIAYRRDLGKYEITDIISQTTTSTTTTTTAGLSPCQGNCKWVSNDGIDWTLDEDNCSQTSTTTTSSTTTTTTACDCPYHVDGTTTTSDPTTTTTPDCKCIYPAMCPENTGDITYTDCGTGETQPPECTTSSTTTTTSCDCSNIDDGCPGNCTWVGDIDFSGTWYWRLVSGSCEPSKYCECVQPSTSPYCAPETQTNCQPKSPPPGVNPCKGTCLWEWVASQQHWHMLSYSCDQGVECWCDYPPIPDNPTSDCPTTVTTCSEHGTTTTWGGVCTDPCVYQCLSECTTSSTTTTTTDCDGGCRYQWNGSQWVKYYDSCESYCPCVEPLGDGTTTGEIAIEYCGDTTTTTTTPSSCGGEVVFRCFDDGDGYAWHWQSANCAGACTDPQQTCRGPNVGDEWMVSAPCDSGHDGQYYYWACSCDELPTTTSSTTTSTTCGAPLSGDCMYVCRNGSWVVQGSACEEDADCDTYIGFCVEPCTDGDCCEVLCTTTTTTTTTSSTTTTTTCASAGTPATGYCRYQCWGDGQWHLASDQCAAGEQCPGSSSCGTCDGTTKCNTCDVACETTTTTTTTTSSTTTSTTSATGACCYGVDTGGIGPSCVDSVTADDCSNYEGGTWYSGQSCADLYGQPGCPTTTTTVTSSTTTTTTVL